MSESCQPASATPIALEDTLTYRLHRLQKLNDKHSALLYRLQTGLSLSDHRCLTTIGYFAPLTINTLAEKSNLNKSQASRAAQALVTKKLVKKTATSSDQRQVLVELTTLGRKHYLQAMQAVAHRNHALQQTLSPKELHLLQHLLDRLIDHIDHIDNTAYATSVPNFKRLHKE